MDEFLALQAARGNPAGLSAAGLLIPENTRITQADPALTLLYRQDGRVWTHLPRVILAKEKVKQFIIEQDALREHATARSPNDPYRVFDPRMDSRDIETEFHGLACRVKDHDAREASPGIPSLLDTKKAMVRDIVADGFERRLVTKLTTDGNYATGHVLAAGTAWSAAAGDPSANVASAIQKIVLTCGKGVLPGGKFVGICSRPTWDSAIAGSPDIQSRWSGFTSRADRPLSIQPYDAPTRQYIAGLLNLSDIWVSEAVSGPSARKQSVPVKSNNTFIWPTASDRFVVMYVPPTMGAMGVVGNGTPAGLALASLYGPGELDVQLDDTYRDGSGGVVQGQCWDDGVFEPTITDVNGKLMAVAAITDVIS